MTKPYYQDDLVTILHGDCIEQMRALPDASIDAVVTDPPYGLGFMGKEWDDLPPGVDFAREALRVLKPGGHMVAFGGSRTWHRLAVAIEDAGFEIRDSIAWLYGSGFPKSLDVSKVIDKAQGVKGGRGPMKRGGERLLNQTTDGAREGNGTWGDESGRDAYTYAPGGDDAKRWQGWGTALKPAFEPIVVARKPLAGTVAANVLAYGTGALNIDATRIAGSKPDTTRGASSKASSMAGLLGAQGRIEDDGRGRWPTNVALDDTQAEVLDEQSGYQRDGTAVNRNKDATATKPANVYGAYKNGERPDQTYGGGGGASRFFPTFRFEAKAPTSERPVVDGVAHPTVKPLALMRWLCRLVTPPGGRILEPFAGSGTTVEAALAEGFTITAIEREADYLPLIRSRIEKGIQPVMDIWGGDAA